MSTPDTASSSGSSSRAAGTTSAGLETLLAGLATPTDGQQAASSAESLAAALHRARAGGQTFDQVDVTVTEAVDRALSTPQGRQAVFAAGLALDGHAFDARPTGSPTGSGAPAVTSTGRTLGLPDGGTLRVRPVADQAPPVRYYFVNGILNTYADALATRERLAGILGTDDLTLVYNHSAKELWSLQIHACLRALQRTGMADEILATDQSWRGWLRQKVTNTVSAGLRGACAGVDTVVDLSVQGELAVVALARGALELALQRVTDADAASTAVNSQLVPMLKQDVLAGRRVVVIGHSQGTLFVHNALEQVRAWWDAGADGRRPASCEGLIAANRPPVGALYISPAFTTDNDTRLERYVAMKGDVLQVAGVSSSEWTARPDYRQSDPSALGDSVGIHAVANYLLDGSESLGQVTDNVKVLTTALGELPGMDPCPDATSPSGSPSTEITSGASEWVVWVAVKPFDGIGINVTSKRSYLEDNLASSWSGGGLDPKATFTKRLLIGTVFGSEREAMTALCAGLTDVRMWPLGTGMHGVWKGTAYPLGDSVSCPPR